jgi:tetratricopeptide (TPR) repeat protein
MVLLWILGFALTFALLREFWLQLLLPAFALHLRARGRRAQATKTLERAAARPSLFGERGRIEVRYRLAWLYMEDRRYDAAIQQCRTILARRLRPSVEASVRARLAECLEAAGDPAGAETERQRARNCLISGAGGGDTYFARGKLLARDRKYEEAREAYQQALAAIPAWNNFARAEVMVHLALASFDAGQPAETVRWAEEAMLAKPTTDLLITAHRTAGVGYSSQGRLDEAELHVRSAAAIAAAAGNAQRTAGLLLQLAGIQMKRGKLVETMEVCAKACGMDLEARRQARLIEGESLRLWGRYDQARTAFEQARQAPGHPQPSAERRSQATLALDQAWLEAEAGDPDAARRYLQEAVEGLGADEKLGLWCAATDAWVLALSGSKEESRERMVEAEARASRFAADPGTQKMCLAMLGQAAYALGEFDRSIEFWTEYLRQEPTPVFRPRGLYFLGECHRQLGREEPAKEAFGEAVDLGIDTYHARQAQRRLAAHG